MSKINIIENRLKSIFSTNTPSLLELNHKTFFITGGTGFIGKWFLSLLIFLNKKFNWHFDVSVLSRNPDHFLQAYPQFKLDWIHFYRGSLEEKIYPENKKFDYILFFAEKNHNKNQKILTPLSNDLSEFEVFLSFCKKIKPKKVLLMSSGAVYGSEPAPPSGFTEDMCSAPHPTELKSYYGEKKRLFELLINLHLKPENINFNTARGFSFMGPFLPLDAQFAFGNFIKNVAQNEPISMNGDGTPIRTYLHGADLSLWIATLLLYGTEYETYNFGSDENITILELAKKIIKISKKELHCSTSTSNQPTDRYTPNINKIKKLNLKPWTSIDEGIFDMLQLYQKNE